MVIEIKSSNLRKGEVRDIDKLINQYKEILNEIKQLPEAKVTEKNFRMAGIISDLITRFSTDSKKTVIVGGLSVNYYTEGEYATQDIDIIARINQKIEDILKELGFVKTSGRHFSNDDLKIYIEFPSEPLEADPSRLVHIETQDGFQVSMIGLDDILIDRIRARVNWKEGIQTKWIRQLWIKHKVRFDVKYIEEKLKNEELEFFKQLQNAYEDIHQTAIGRNEKFKMELEILYEDQQENRVFYNISSLDNNLILILAPESYCEDVGEFGGYFAMSFYPVLNIFMCDEFVEEFVEIANNPVIGVTLEEAIDFIKVIQQKDLKENIKATNNYNALIRLLRNI